MKFLSVLILLVALTGCYYDRTEPTNEEKCHSLTATYASYESCGAAVGCRLNDREYAAWRQAKISSVKYCSLFAVELQNELDEAE